MSPDSTLRRISLIGATAFALAACTGLQPQQPSTQHLGTSAADQAAIAAQKAAIPAPVATTISLPRPKATGKVDTYSVSVRNVPVEELLFALARDAKLNVDLHPGIHGLVTINAIDQTLQQILSRLAKQVDMRWEIDGPNLSVMPDTPFLRTYRIDYVNMTRDVKVTTEVSSLVTSSGGSAGASGGGTALTRIESAAKNRFWETLDKNIKEILHETDKILPEGSSETVIERSDVASTSGTGAAPATGTAPSRASAQPSGIAASPNPASLQQSGSTVVKRTTFREAASVISNPETGIMSVRATSRQHERVQEFIDQIMASARRQVLIEATIAEVTLSQNYQQGIDWQRLRRDGTGFGLTQSNAGLLTSTTGGATISGINQFPAGTLSSAVTDSIFTLTFKNSAANSVNFAAAVKLLESYGNVKVLSSPKLSVLNNQTALLKVVKNEVYFNVKADTTTSNGVATTNVTTTPQSVSVGVVMSVTPQISESDSVVLNVRPMISRITGYKNDPNPQIAAAGQINRVPEIETRELESVLRIGNGDITVLGGLMQDGIDLKEDGIPGLSGIPAIGSLFSYKNDRNTKTELVIFLRPVVVQDPSLSGDLRGYASALPNEQFLRREWRPKSALGEENP